MTDLNEILYKCGTEKIKGIKILRDATNIGLKEAKEIIDQAYEMKKRDQKSNVNILLENKYNVRANVSHDVANMYIEFKEDHMGTLIGKGFVETVWNVNQTKVLRYQQEIWHDGLKEHKVVTAPEKSMLVNKVRVQEEKWNSTWATLSEKKRISDMKKASSEEAARRTIEAEEAIAEVDNLLISALDVNDAVDWEILKNKDDFKVPYPVKPIEPKPDTMPVQPNKTDLEFQPKIPFFACIFRSLKDKAIAEAEHAYEMAYDSWKSAKDATVLNNNRKKESHARKIEEFNKKVSEWGSQETEFLDNQKEFNVKIDEQKALYLSSDESAILEYCEMVLEKSSLPDFMHKDFEMYYNPDNKILIIDYMLPNIDAFPNVKEVKYIASRNELKETYQNDAFMDKLFDATIYRMILRILHEEFEADIINAIDAISLNGWVNYMNKATGNNETACIASIQVKKDAFKNIDLRNVDPKACFKNLKGVASSKLAGITPVQPILTINKEDRRFVGSYDVAHTLDDSTNLAAIPWEDFEHLIRELFEAEFSSNGGEVKVTQASRDGGVDAVAFDPDPIRGGKIVIQAKRYTNTVGVSAVRDLYGTVMNEGATKGILVTTADYGPDAYDFANNKPLTLLNGGNLLHLLEKHGHKAKIDLMEAKALNSTNKQV